MSIFDYFKRKKEEKVEAERQLKIQQEADFMLPQYIKHVVESLDLIGNTSNPQTFIGRRSFLIKEGTEAIKWMKISNRFQDSDVKKMQEVVDKALRHGYEDEFMLNVVRKLNKKVAKVKLPKTKIKYYKESLSLINQFKNDFKSESISWLNAKIEPEILSLKKKIDLEKQMKELKARGKYQATFLNGEDISKKGSPEKSNEVLLPLLKTLFDDDGELYWRLAINYRKLKDYQSEINIIEKALSKEKMYWSFHSKQQFENRLNKAKILLEKK
ncbi:MAG: hypothetical protein ABF741_00935 [Liquorilactobacillus ghanensis]|uniref:hypothetical protein n=2 Tax=Liquorilactobacillus ghanensis TaxID=399370 RepID=UPI0039EC9A01